MLYDFDTLLTTEQKDTIAHIVTANEAVDDGAMLAGIVSGYCDSGILTDSYSIKDAELAAEYLTEEEGYELALEEIEQVLQQRAGQGLQCWVVIQQLTNAADGDAELGAAYAGKLLGMIDL